MKYVVPNRDNKQAFKERKNYNVINVSHCNSVSDDVIKILCSRSKIISLNISYNNSITDESIQFLLEKTGKNLRILNAEGCEQLTSKSLSQIFSSAPNLEELYIWNLQYVDRLSGLSKLKQLQKLSFRNSTEISSKMIRQNILPFCQLIHELDLTSCNITDTECKAILKFSNLSKLVLDGCTRVTNKGILQLLENQKLQHISLARDILFFFFILIFNLTTKLLIQFKDF